MNHYLFLHGALGSASDFDLFQNAYFGDSTLHTLDFLGHGNELREDPPKFRIESMADQLILFLQSQQPKKFHLFGYSMGGYVALYAASLVPDLCLTITTLGTKYDWNPSASAKEASMLDPSGLEQNYPEWALQLAHKHGQSRWKSVAERTSEMMIDLGNHPRLTVDALSKIVIPCVIGRGSKDKMVSKEESESMARQIPGAQYKELESAAHALDRISKEILAPFILGQ